MKVVRTVQKEDVDSLLALIDKVGDGMTTLKPNKKMMSKRIMTACESFAETNPLAERDYVFVMEETNNNQLVGICAIRSRVGLDGPFYNFRIGTIVHSSKELNVYTRMNTLYLSNDLTGCSELCSLFLHPNHRTSDNGRLLSKSRFLFIAQFPHLFSEQLIAELRGFQRPDGSSPFWDSLGRHFFQMEFSRADNLSSEGKKSFIAELMPQYPLYVDYLSHEAQQAIGQVHTDTAPARHLLEKEGFAYEGYIDIFDGGPVLHVKESHLRSVRESKVMRVCDATADHDLSNNEPLLVANTSMDHYRIIVSHATPNQDQLPLTKEEQNALQCDAQSEVRVMTLNVKKG